MLVVFGVVLRVGIIHMGFFYSGGGERVVLTQAHELMKMGHYVTVYAPTLNGDCFPELQKGLNLVELSSYLPENVPVRSALGMVSSSFVTPFRDLVDNDVIIAHAQPSNWIAYRLKKRYGIPYISYLHQVNRFFKPRSIDKSSGWKTNNNIAFLELLHKGNFIIKYLDKLSISYADKVLTNSNWIRAQICKYYHIDPVVCYPGAELERFSPRDSKSCKRFILSTNRHFPQKRIDYLIQVMRGIVEKYDDIHCLITGGFTNHTSDLLKLREKYDLTRNVHFTGKLSSHQLDALYGKSYTYAYTSPEEDFGLGPVESGASGVPSIVWDNAGPRETVIDGVTGFRIKPFNVEEMTKRHIQLLEDEELRNRMGENAYYYVNTKFTWKSHCEEINSIINQIT